MSETQQPSTASVMEALAFVVAADGYPDEAKLRRLEACDAFRVLGLDRGRLVERIRDRVAGIDGALHEHSWLPSHIEETFDDVLDAVTEPGQRQLVCRLVMAVFGQDPEAHPEQRILFEHMRARWRVCSDEAVPTADATRRSRDSRP